VKNHYSTGTIDIISSPWSLGRNSEGNDTQLQRPASDKQQQQQKHNNNNVPYNKSNKILVHRRGTLLLIDVFIPSDRNVLKNEAEKIRSAKT
jgi:hypothetical protein